MFGNLFKKAKDSVAGAAESVQRTASNFSDAVRGVEHVDWIDHAFPYSLEMMMDMDDARDLSRPYPPQGFPQDAIAYSETWYETWARVRDGHIPPVIAIENGDYAGAVQALEAWIQQIQAADVAQAHLGDYQGGRHLVLANNDVNTDLGAMVEAVRNYIGVRVHGADAIDIATECISRVVGIHLTMNNCLLGFYADPQGVAAKAAEDAAFAPIEAMRSGVNSDGPEFEPIYGVTLHDWIAAGAKIHAGTHTMEDVCRILGIERPQWDAANNGWIERIGQYPMTVGMQSGTLGSVPNPKFEQAGGSVPQGNAQAAQRLRTDRNFYIECSAAANAATEAGLDAGGYLQQNYGVTIGDVAHAGTAWMMDMRGAGDIITLQQAKQREFAQKFAAERGGGIADDIEF